MSSPPVPVPLLRRALALRPHRIQFGDGHVMRFGTEAAEEHDVFLVGTFQRVTDARSCARGAGDIVEADVPATRVLRVLHQGEQRVAGKVRQLHLAVDIKHCAGSDVEVLAVEDAIEDIEPALRERDVDEEGLEHLIAIGPVLVCEASHTPTVAPRPLSAVHT